MVVKSQYVSSLETAIEMCLIIAEASVKGPLCSGVNFRSALAKACEGSRLTTSKLQLSYCARVWCSCIRTTVEGRYTADLDEALMQRDQILSAGQEDWLTLRSRLICIRQPP